MSRCTQLAIISVEEILNSRIKPSTYKIHVCVVNKRNNDHNEFIKTSTVARAGSFLNQIKELIYTPLYYFMGFNIKRVPLLLIC